MRTQSGDSGVASTISDGRESPFSVDSSSGDSVVSVTSQVGENVLAAQTAAKSSTAPLDGKAIEVVTPKDDDSKNSFPQFKIYGGDGRI